MNFPIKTDIKQISPSTHTIQYKGLTIICEAGLYYVAGWPSQKFTDFGAARRRVDELAPENPTYE